MRKRKDSHDGSPVGDTNILFVPDSSADPSASGVDALMGMIDEAGAPHALTHGRARGETSPAGRTALWQDERVPYNARVRPAK